jgi:hypothetical protein
MANSLLVSTMHRIFREFGKFAILTAYFYVVFAVLVLFKATLLHTYGIRYVVWGGALIKSVLIAKFLMIGEGVRVASVRHQTPLLKTIAEKVFLMAALVIALICLEQIVRGLLHHQSIGGMAATLVGSGIGEKVSEAMILLLTLIPIVAFDALSEALGKNRFRQLLFYGSAPSPTDDT